MTDVFVITPKNRTPQSLRRHSALVYQQWRTMMIARSGRVCFETLLSINNRGRGARPCGVKRSVRRLGLRQGVGEVSIIAKAILYVDQISVHIRFVLIFE